MASTASNPSPSPVRRVAIVVSHAIQYYAPWFQHLAARPEMSIRVFYLSDHGVAARRDRQFGGTFTWDTDLLSGYAHEFVPNQAARPDVTRFSGLRNPGLRAALAAFSPHAVVLFGYACRTNLGLLLRPPAPIVFRGDSHLLGAPPPRGLKRLLLSLIFRRCSAFLPVGRANTDYYHHYGVPASRLFLAPHAVNQAHFTATPELQAAAAAQRATLGIPAEAPVVLFAGKLIPKKRPDLLLSAFLEAAVPGSHLVLSGDGELQPSLRAAAQGRADVHFLPFANQSAMPARYLLGDVFVLPSEGRHETWGLAVNEAMHLGLPCIVSDQVGCHLDLLKPPHPSLPSAQTGWVFRAGDGRALASILRSALSLGRPGLAVLGEQARAHAAAWSYTAATAGLAAALDSLNPPAP